MKPEGITGRPVPPWQLPGAVRRDCEPHRGPLLAFLATSGVVTAGVSALFPLWPVTGPLALTLTLAASWMARRDLALMRRGLMDPGGEAQTRRALHEALGGAIMAVIAAILAGAVFGPPLLSLFGVHL